MEGGYQLIKKVCCYGSVTRKNSLNCLQWLELLLTFAGVDNASFYYKSSFKEFFKANLSFKTLQLTEGFGV